MHLVDIQKTAARNTTISLETTEISRRIGEWRTKQAARARASVSFSVLLPRYFSRHLPNGVLARGLHGFFPWLKEFFTG